MNAEQMNRIVTEVIATWGARVLVVLVALFVAWFVASATRSMLLRTLDRVQFDTTLSRFFGNLARYAILVASVLGCLGAFGIETTSFAAIIAAGGLAVGLAFQGTLSNFAAGVMLLAFRPFKVGDVVKVGGIIGTVQEIELFTTELTAPDNRKIIVPNSAVFGSTIENLTAHEIRRVDVPVGTEYRADLDRVREVLETMVAALPRRIEAPASQVFLSSLGSSSIEWSLRVWCKTEDYWDVHQALVRGAKMALDQAGIGIPFPQRDVHIDATVVDRLSAR